MHDPWADVGRLSDWAVTWTSDVRVGLCRWPTRTIALNPALRDPLLRCVLMHEVVHAERGPSPSWARAREEHAVRDEASRRLIDVRDLGEALAWSQHPAVVADLLWVDGPTLAARLEHLTTSERGYIACRLSDLYHP